MKIVRDDKGHICQINMDDGSEIPSNEIKTAFDVIAADEKEITARSIAVEKEITARHKEKCDFWRSIIIDTVPPAIDRINVGLSKRDVENMSLELKDLS